MTEKINKKPIRIKKIRVDQLLVDRGLVENRTKAQALIMAGKVFNGEQRINKAGDKIANDKPLEIRGQPHPWVSRGGLKLEAAVKYFDINIKGLIAMDVGSSTGGFSDLLLQNGAKKIYAIDVGRGQLHWKLRSDDRVIVMEGTNARYLTNDDIKDKIDMIVCDASFIGLEKVLERPLEFAADEAWLVALIKPQFQVGKGLVGKGGIVRDPELHKRTCDEISSWIASLDGWNVEGIIESPITGARGNIEFLITAKKSII